MVADLQIITGGYRMYLYQHQFMRMGVSDRPPEFATGNRSVDVNGISSCRKMLLEREIVMRFFLWSRVGKIYP